MKKTVSLTLVCLIPAAVAFATEIKIINYIPERYAQLLITGVEPDKPLDKDKILATVKDESEKVKVKQFQFVVYDKGKKQGDGVRVFGEVCIGIKCTDGLEPTDKEKAQLQGKVLENHLCYSTTPKELHAAYSDNEVVADDYFKGKPVCFNIKVPEVAKDAFEKPYINIKVDKFGLYGAHIYIDNNDPFLRRIKKGSDIFILAYPKRFVMKSVMLDGKILSDGKAWIIDGKAVPDEDIFGKPEQKYDSKKK